MLFCFYMAESVQTGGMMSFRYPRQRQVNINPELKKGIDEAYEDYYERKKEEKRRKRILWLILLILGIIIVSGIIYFVNR